LRAAATIRSQVELPFGVGANTVSRLLFFGIFGH